MSAFFNITNMPDIITMHIEDAIAIYIIFVPVSSVSDANISASPIPILFLNPSPAATNIVLISSTVIIYPTLMLPDIIL